MWQLMLDRPEDLSSLVRQFVDIQFEIQRGGLPTGLPDFVDRLCGKISEAGVLSEAERNEAADLARSLPRGAALLHGDLHPGNILMGSEGPVVRAQQNAYRVCLAGSHRNRRRTNAFDFVIPRQVGGNL